MLRLERCFGVHITKQGLGNQKHFKPGPVYEIEARAWDEDLVDAQTPKTTLE